MTICFFILLPRPPTPSLFPYTTLFRSAGALALYETIRSRALRAIVWSSPAQVEALWEVGCVHGTTHDLRTELGKLRIVRSEEHTSELQSLRHLVCRLLLEKKKKQININCKEHRTGQVQLLEEQPYRPE